MKRLKRGCIVKIGIVLIGVGLCACSTDASPLDGRALDSGADGHAGDAPSVDLLAADVGKTTDAADDQASPDGGAEGCAGATLKSTAVGSGIVACIGAANTVSQCKASAFCKAGWALCSASEYLKTFGALAPAIPAASSLWIGGCVRDGAAPFSPKDGVCSKCAADKGPEVTVSWSCVNTVTVDTATLHVGIRTSSACTFAGVNQNQSRGFWMAWPTTQLTDGAICCKKP